MIASDLISGSLRLIGALASGDNVLSAELNDGLTSLNAMIDGWHVQKLLIPTPGRFVFALTPGKATYSIGPATEGSADIVTARPLRISRAGLIISQSDATQAIEQPIDVLTEGEWQLVRMKGLPSDFPRALYYEPDYPFGTIALYPVPSQANSIALYIDQALAPFANLSSTVDVPPGYMKALRYCLAVELAPEYGVTPSELVIQQALLSLQYIKSTNALMRLNKLRVDPSIRGKLRGFFDWMTGEVR